MPYKGNKRKKHRTHKEPDPQDEVGVPKSFIVRRGKTDKSVLELVKDLREVMLPHTAERLRERKSNTLKDFVSVAGSLHVSHLMMFSQTEQGNLNLRVGRLPRGPTVTFRVEQYTTTRLLRASQKRPVDTGLAYEHSPLVVLHNFSAPAGQAAEAGTPAAKAQAGAGVSKADALKMAETTFKAMFPALNPASVKLDHCRRVLLVHHNRGSGRLELRHYLIRAVPVGVSKGVKKLALQGKLPDLSKLEDVASFVLNGGRSGGGGPTSDSEAEEDAAHRVTLPAAFHGGKGNTKASQSAIKLTEIGPRLSLTLVKIEGGLCEGDVLYHAWVSKSAEEAAALKVRAQQRAKLKQQRKAEQEKNVASKKAAAEAKASAKEERLRMRQEAAERAAAAGRLGGEADEEVEEADRQARAAQHGAKARRGTEESEGEEEEDDGYENDDDDEEEEYDEEDCEGEGVEVDDEGEGEGRMAVGEDDLASDEELQEDSDDDDDDDGEEEEDEQEEVAPPPILKQGGKGGRLAPAAVLHAGQKRPAGRR